MLCLNAGQDEEWLHNSDMLDKDDRQRELLLYQPPDESKLNALRETKIREKQLKNKFIKLGDYLFILLVLVLVSYGNRDPKSFLMRNSMEQEFIRPLTASYPQRLDDVNNLQLFLKWGEHSLIPHLYEQDWYNGDKVINRTGFTSSRASKRLGRIRLRQARIENGSCTVPKLVRDVIHECNPPYHESYEDTRMYSPGWIDGIQTESTMVNKRSASGQLSPWVYLDPAESNSSLTVYGRIAFYPAGGYVAEFGDNIEETKALFNYLKSTRWIDRYTRAIIIEGAIYNPNTNLIGVVETALEMTSASAILPRVDFKIFRLFARLNPSYAFNSACEMLFFVILLYTLYTIIKGIYQRGKKEYYRETISWLDTLFFVDGFAIVVVYIVRESKLRSAVDTLKKDQEWFINFSECGLYSEALVYLYAFADFIAILKFIHFLSFTRCVQLLSTTIYRSVVELQSFAVMLFAIFMAYASMAFTIYGPYLEHYRSVSATLGSLLSLVMGVFEHTDFTSQPDYKAVGYFFFATFSFSMMFIFMNIVITIINVVHSSVCADEELKKNEGNFFNIILERLLIFTGFRGPPQREEPKIEEPRIAELQWNWHVQYLMENQLKRLSGLVNSIYTHDELEEISLLRALPLPPELERKAVTEHGSQGNKCIALSHAADQANECEHGRRDNDVMTHPNQGPFTKESDQQLQNAPPASKPQNTSIETITQLIAKKTEELERLEEEGACDEKERLRRIKVIKCLQDLLNKATGNQDSVKLCMSHEEESEV
ncbi:hypothetical protein ACROYT_G006233 [Oculina patagonica]